MLGHFPEAVALVLVLEMAAVLVLAHDLHGLALGNGILLVLRVAHLAHELEVIALQVLQIIYAVVVGVIFRFDSHNLRVSIARVVRLVRNSLDPSCKLRRLAHHSAVRVAHSVRLRSVDRLALLLGRSLLRLALRFCSDQRLSGLSDMPSGGILSHVIRLHHSVLGRLKLVLRRLGRSSFFGSCHWFGLAEVLFLLLRFFDPRFKQLNFRLLLIFGVALKLKILDLPDQSVHFFERPVQLTLQLATEFRFARFPRFSDRQLLFFNRLRPVRLLWLELLQNLARLRLD